MNALLRIIFIVTISAFCLDVAVACHRRRARRSTSQSYQVIDEGKVGERHTPAKHEIFGSKRNDKLEAVQHWYRIDAYTRAGSEGRWGGTDGDLGITLNGSASSTREIWCDSPGDSCEQGDRDVFYIKSDTIGNLQSVLVRIASRARNQVDNWSYDLTVSVLLEDTNLWVVLGTVSNQEAYAQAITLPGGTPDNPRFIQNASCHYDASAGRWEGPETSGGSPPGVELCN